MLKNDPTQIKHNLYEPYFQSSAVIKRGCYKKKKHDWFLFWNRIHYWNYFGNLVNLFIWNTFGRGSGWNKVFIHSFIQLGSVTTFYSFNSSGSWNTLAKLFLYFCTFNHEAAWVLGTTPVLFFFSKCMKLWNRNNGWD